MGRGVVMHYYFFGGAKKEGNAGHIWQKSPSMALISEYLAADASADALGRINFKLPQP